MKQDLLTAWGDRASQFHLIEVPSASVSVQDCIQSYLFNSQLLSRGDNNMVLIVPGECENNPAVWAYLNSLVTGNSPINEVKVFDLKQSMSNGGGPACLRLRVALTEAERNAINPSTLMNDALFERLNTWVDAHYRDELHEADLADPKLLIESRNALDELTQIMDLGSVYEFQK